MLKLEPATFAEFERETARGNVVPVVRSVLADLQTPVGAFLRVAADSPYAFLLESVEGGERIARYSFLGGDPELIVRGRGDATTVARGDTTETLAGKRVTDYLRAHFQARQLAARPGLAPFAGGAVGYLAYDAARWFEPVLDDARAPARDDAVFMFYRTLLAFDRVRQQIEIVSVVHTDEAAGDPARLRTLYDAAVAETERIEHALLRGVAAEHSAAAPKTDEPASPLRFTSNWTRAEFERAVERIKEHIAAGDCYQAVLSQRLTAAVSAAPLAVYRALRATNPSPYMFFLRLGAEAIVGASPEMLVRCRGAELEYRPIAGTRPRGADEAADEALAAELRADAKEVAEHMMLVDLGRNDLGRVAAYGSVAVRELLTVERYSHVQHLVTGLGARLRAGADRFDALASCFPAGTVTGAPKVRAMQIIGDLEPDPRGIYAGAILYLDYAGNLDSCIAIRTLRLHDGRADVQAGAGIVADSVPAREYEETMNKARALLRALELAEQGL
ncbi:MAG TPA: anthranilate synthase component I family protein [Pyrinomonadaceae bacterium]|jgi:anthranilate synthase component 1